MLDPSCLNNLATFSPDYRTARDRFCAAAQSAHCLLESWEIEHRGPDGQELTIDVARWGAPQPQEIIVISSGLHGVEGFFGSAVQLTLLQSYLSHLPFKENQALILIHALNPYGFAYLRRWNEDNVDLNRNFLLSGDVYQGSPVGYAQLHALLNPERPPTRLNLFYLKAIATILQVGFAQLKTSLASGQYDFPKGLFFGGQGVSKTQQLLAAHLPQWIGSANRVIHIDLHTGLGTWGAYQLLTGATSNAASFQRLCRWFSPEAIESSNQTRTAYPIRGGLGQWCQQQFPACEYEFLTAEFGTYSGLAVVAALRAENQAHWWGDAAHHNWTKQRLKEVFAPADSQWRSQVLAQAIAVIQQACQALSLT